MQQDIGSNPIIATSKVTKSRSSMNKNASIAQRVVALHL
jgi:hypothetical protein